MNKNKYFFYNVNNSVNSRSPFEHSPISADHMEMDEDFERTPISADHMEIDEDFERTPISADHIEIDEDFDRTPISADHMEIDEDFDRIPISESNRKMVEESSSPPVHLESNNSKAMINDYLDINKLKYNVILVNNTLWVKSLDFNYYMKISNSTEFRKYLLKLICLHIGEELFNSSDIFSLLTINKVSKLYQNMLIDFRNEKSDDIFCKVDNLLPLKYKIVEVLDGKINILDYYKCNAFFKTSINASLKSKLNSHYTEKFLDGFLGNNNQNARDRFWELMGNLLFSNQDAKVLCCLYGKGNDGKSTLIRFLQKLFLTPDAVCSSDMKTAFSTHGSASFENANIVVLQESNDIIKQAHADMIKRLTGGDGITINPKHRNMKPKNIKIKLLMVCNHPLRFAEGVIDDALKSRFEFIQVYSVPSEQRNPNLLYDLLSESDYFIQKSIDGFARLQKNNYRFTESKKDSDLKESIFCNDPAQDFIDMCCDICPDGFLETNSFNKAYNHWSKTYPDHITKKELKTGIINKGYLHKRQRTNNSQPYGFVGLKLKSLI